MQRENLYLPFNMSGTLLRGEGAFGSQNTGAAWLSSARVVRCWVKSRNERNPVTSCHHLVGHSRRLPVTNRRKVGMTSSPHGPYG